MVTARKPVGWIEHEDVADTPTQQLARKAADEAWQDLRARLDARAIIALKSGYDWAEGPMQSGHHTLDQMLVYSPVHTEMYVMAGPILPGSNPPRGFHVIRVKDWERMGKPGL